ncbi:hypothetical protein [Acaryochloris sp. IP29b_bin.148]|uniref:hypothetical protein n=1 Tax=Acaryochloris sp. IP29b_bin.148 TaxID=2969218 RepID=UPI002619B71C|nr:hypothetical protein [Acaryochloris sp. IP29b_bin.148]
MSEPSAWQDLTVHEFLQAYNWSGQKLPEGSKPHAAEGEMANWQRQTVQTFLSQLNWLGLPVKPQTLVPSSQSFSTRLTIKDFFQYFAWEGHPNIAAIPDISKSSLIAPEDDLNLNDFSDMF